MPEPIVEPMSTATALHNPSWRLSAGERSDTAEEVDMRECYGAEAVAGRGRVRDAPISMRGQGLPG